MILSVGSVIISILAFVFSLGLIILVHEGGHFFFARRVNILCREYAFGMGPQLVKTKKGETVYSIRAFPVGGFCAIAGEELEDDPLKDLKEVRLFIEDGFVKKIILDEKNNLYSDVTKYEILEYDLFDEKDSGHLFIKVKDNEEELELPVHPQALYVFTKVVKNDKLSKEKQINKYTQEIQIAPHNRTLNAKSKGARAMVMFGGPLMNFITAIIVFLIAGFITGFADEKHTILDEVTEDTPAYMAGLREDDEIIELQTLDKDSKIISSGKLENWDDLSQFMDLYKSNDNCVGDIIVVYNRNGEQLVTTITPMVVIYSISMTQDLSDTENVKIGELATGSIAYKSGLRYEDVITAIRYKDEDVSQNVNISSWKQVYSLFTNNIYGEEMVVTVNRNGEIHEVTVDPYDKETFDKTQDVEITALLLGVSPRYTFNFVKSLIYPFTEFWGSLVKMVNTLGMLFGSNDVGVDDLSGPIGIFNMTSQIAQNGLGSLLNWIGFLSVNIGFMNLLPIPALDGGRLVFVAYEAITKKKPSEKVETALITVTMLLLFGLMIYVSFNDILRLFGK